MPLLGGDGEQRPGDSEATEGGDMHSAVECQWGNTDIVRDLCALLVAPDPGQVEGRWPGWD